MRFRSLIASSLLSAYSGAIVALCLWADEPRNPAGWGSDHVGKPSSEFMSGDECLFCHRDVGPSWPINRHGQTIREAEASLPAISALAAFSKERATEADLLMGGRNRQRFARRSTEHGKLDLLSVELAPSKSGLDGRLINRDQPRWDGQTFGDRCAGCHATAVDSAKRTFAAASLDCFVCHGNVPEEHTTSGKLVHLSPKRKEDPAVVASICGQCHLRGGSSKSSGLPYPNNFVAGDNLFRDFKVALTSDNIAKLNPADRHVFENVRDVVILDKRETTCLSCHEIHKQSSKKHRELADGSYCLSCHPGGSKRELVRYEVHSKTCEY